jgi:hypothetical protein
VANEEEYEPTFWERVSPQFYGIAVLVMNVAFAVAGLALLYLLYGIFSGQLAVADPKRVLSLVAMARTLFAVGVAVGTFCAAFITYNEESSGYIILGSAAAIGIGIPVAYSTVGGNMSGLGVRAALAALQAGVLVPAVVGGFLVARDVVLRMKDAFTKKAIDQKKMSFGSEAEKERLPLRTSLMAKCWEGPYCREFIRVHCPIFVARQACWRVKRGCYCEEDIVVQASQKAQGVPLQMAPDAKYNFANPPTPGRPAPSPNTLGGIGSNAPPMPISIGPAGTGGLGDVDNGSPVAPGNKAGLAGLGAVGSAPLPITIGDEYHPPQANSRELSSAQKRERCRNCIIYNEHQREKYSILMPVVLIGGILLCVALGGTMRDSIGGAIAGFETMAARLAFSGNAAPKVNRPPAPMEWFLVGAFSLMIVSKMLQILEWACFKVKI